MRRPTINLVLAVCGLAGNLTANADDQVSLVDAGPALSVNASALDVPPVLPPNDGAALSLNSNPQEINLDVEQPDPAPALPPVLAPSIAVPAPANVSEAAPIQAQPLIIDQAQPAQLAYFSPRLGARFLVGPVTVPQFGTFSAARLVSQPAAGSPLCQIGLNEGDLITRLDGLPMTCTVALEGHVLQTGVRFIRNGELHVCEDMMFIDPGMYFLDPYAVPSCSHSRGCGRPLVLLP